MPTTLNHTDGKVTKFEGGVAHVTDQPTSSPKPEAPVQQVLDPDPFSDAAHVIENLSGEEAALSMMDDLMLDQSMNWFQMGGVLLQIKKNEWFGGYGSFGNLCPNKFGFGKSKGYHLVAIYERVLEAGLSWDDVKELGWPKLRLICAKAANAKLDKEEFF